MLALKKKVVNLFVDRSTGQWIVHDPDGNFWILPCDAQNPWDLRQPFYPMADNDLERVPGHYKYMLNLPF